jgi:hypothetical protein
MPLHMGVLVHGLLELHVSTMNLNFDYWSWMKNSHGSSPALSTLLSCAPLTLLRLFRS